MARELGHRACGRVDVEHVAPRGVEVAGGRHQPGQGRVQSAQLLFCSVGTPQWMQAGLVLAYSRAACRIRSLSTQVISWTFSSG